MTRRTSASALVPPASALVPPARPCRRRERRRRRMTKEAAEKVELQPLVAPLRLSPAGAETAASTVSASARTAGASVEVAAAVGVREMYGSVHFVQFCTFWTRSREMMPRFC